MPAAYSLRPVSALSVVAETLFKYRRDEVVDGRIVVCDDNGMFFVDKFFHEVFGDNC
jgi:DNA-directed RNA polymerase subunit E'/Rpb7